MLYPELFKQLESVRWDMDKDIPWDTFDPSLLTEEQALLKHTAHAIDDRLAVVRLIAAAKVLDDLRNRQVVVEVDLRRDERLATI